ncbi:hypothetical protein BJY52DRAFT_1421917 [Lactarius psammicola]|nr:hypothetical protein BJY52DRAFT_1421917 [Lactarius psammicola]
MSWVGTRAAGNNSGSFERAREIRRAANVTVETPARMSAIENRREKGNAARVRAQREHRPWAGASRRSSCHTANAQRPSHDTDSPYAYVPYTSRRHHCASVGTDGACGRVSGSSYWQCEGCSRTRTARLQGGGWDSERGVLLVEPRRVLSSLSSAAAVAGPEWAESSHGWRGDDSEDLSDLGVSRVSLQGPGDSELSVIDEFTRREIPGKTY